MFKKIIVIIFALAWLILAINPVHPGIWAMENLLVAVIFPIVLWLDHKYRFTNTTFLVLTIFVILHLFGAHYTYERMTGFNMVSEFFGWERNYYDQLIHFLFGLMVFMPFYEVFSHQGMSRNMSYLLAFLFISAINSWYEILEWLAMVVFCREPNCSDFITQRDVWDTQKDMAYATVGALLAMLIHRYFTKTGRSG